MATPRTLTDKRAAAKVWRSAGGGVHNRTVPPCSTGEGSAVRRIVLLLALAVAGCDESPPPSSQGLVCTDEATPILLASRLDDEDGDGHPLDELFPLIDDEDDDIADHAWIRDRTGRYHLFFHNEGRGAPHFIEHYTSNDLASLDYVGVALAAGDGGWDASGLWAPHVIRVDDTYYMFYTGLDAVGPGAKQRIGVAVSADLSSWQRLGGNRCPGTTGDGCVYECRESWTTWGDASEPFNHQCRDPFVIRDEENNRWLLFVTARGKDGFGMVTVAASEDLAAWRGAGYLDATRLLPGGSGGQPTGGQAENPFVIARAGEYTLLFTDWRDPEDSLSVADPRTMVQYATSASLAVDSLGSAGWQYRGYIPDPGVNAIEVIRAGLDTWIMSQSISNPNSGYVKPIRRQLRLKCVLWTGGGTFATSNLGFTAVREQTPLSGE